MQDVHTSGIYWIAEWTPISASVKINGLTNVLWSQNFPCRHANVSVNISCRHFLIDNGYSIHKNRFSFFDGVSLESLVSHSLLLGISCFFLVFNHDILVAWSVRNCTIKSEVSHEDFYVVMQLKIGTNYEIWS